MSDQSYRVIPGPTIDFSKVVVTGLPGGSLPTFTPNRVLIVKPDGTVGVDSGARVSGSGDSLKVSVSSLEIVSGLSSTTHITRYGIALQTADFDQWIDSSGNVLAKVSAAGIITAARFGSGAASYPLPASDGTAGQVLSTLGSELGTAWISVTGGGVIGSNTQVAYNDSGTMAGDANFTWTKGTGRLYATYLTASDFDSEASNSVRIGYFTINNNSGYSPDSVAIGHRALARAFTSVGKNVAVGFTADSGDPGEYNVMIGAYASAKYGYSTVVGAYAGNYDFLPSYNSLFGYYAGRDLRTGTRNVFVGVEAGYRTGNPLSTSNVAQTADKCTFVGSNSGLPANASASNRSAFGYGAYASVDNSVVLGGPDVVQVWANSFGSGNFIGGGTSAPYAVGTDVAGATVTHSPGPGTGAGGGGNYRIQTQPPAASSATPNSPVDRIVIPSKHLSLSNGVASTAAIISLISGNSVGGTLSCTIIVGDGTDLQVKRAKYHFVAVNKGGTITVNSALISESDAVSAGTLAITLTVTTGAGVINLRLTATSSLTHTSISAFSTVEADSFGSLVTMM